jgi:hypothetical protein
MQFVAPLTDYCKTDAEGSLNLKNQCFGLPQNAQDAKFVISLLKEIWRPQTPEKSKSEFKILLTNQALDPRDNEIYF